MTLCNNLIKSRKHALRVLWLFLTVSCVGLQCVIVVFPDHAHSLCYSYINIFLAPVGCQNPCLQRSGFSTALGAQQMLMHRKSCWIPILLYLT